jgi:N-acetyl-D-muramate 6-phosphate phosphatase
MKRLEPLPHLRAVLFDLDGTLVDSAPDLAHAGNVVRERRGLPALPLADFRPMTGSGARGMLAVALQVSPQDAGFEALKDEFLAAYAACLTERTRVFEAMHPVLDALDQGAVPWGIVTNKAHRFTEPVVQGVQLAQRARVVISGDTTARAKPFPDPLLEAARRLALPAEACLYVGDDLRDVQAGRAAGMSTVAVRWGYLGVGEAIEHWGADHVIDAPDQLLNLLALA